MAVRALELTASRRPELLVVEYLLPDMDGLQLLAEVRRRRAAPELPAIVVTGMVSRLEELRAHGGTSTEFLAKPVEPSRLLEAVRAQLSSAGRMASGRRVLVVDDELLNLKLASFRLKQAGYEVETASGALRASRWPAAGRDPYRRIDAIDGRLRVSATRRAVIPPWPPSRSC
jgi:CheY-like chemotaxis protein